MPRCADCGFLATRVHVGKELLETTVEQREKWNPLPIHETTPACFVRAANLAKEIRQTDLAVPLETYALAVISAERTCASFFPWAQGFSPKEHRDMQFTERIDRLQQEQRERDRQWQAEQKEREQKWHEEQKKDDRAFRISEARWNRAWTLFVAITILVLGYFIGRK